MPCRVNLQRELAKAISKMARLVVLLLLLSAAWPCLGTKQSRRVLSRGDLSISCLGSCGAAADCAASAVADIPARWQLPQYSPSWRATSTSAQKWGPHPIQYQSVSPTQIPTGCDPTAWSLTRLLRVITDTIALQLNYCHHHAPAYETPARLQLQCTPSEPGVDGGSCVCNTAGLTKANAWKGLDCSNFASFVYNLAFGFYFTSSIGEQACHPTLAPGRLLSGITTSKLDQLLPGDLVYITLGSKGRSAPVRVSHVTLWTGWTVDFNATSGPLSYAALLEHMSASQRAGVETCVAAKRAAGQPVYVIADSHHNGPELRPFCGWYIGSFSHARRVINPSSSLPTNDASIAYWDASSGSCMSTWALKG